MKSDLLKSCVTETHVELPSSQSWMIRSSPAEGIKYKEEKNLALDVHYKEPIPDAKLHMFVRPTSLVNHVYLDYIKPPRVKASSQLIVLPGSSLQLTQGDRMSWTAGGDWMCSACQHQNFKKRETCQRCGYPKYGGPDPATYICNATKVLAGDWYCTAMNCQAHNYASRSSCYSCGALKNDHAAGGYGSNAYGSDGSADPPGWKTGDWVCTRFGCGVHNYACRMECFKCRTPRDQYSGGY
ncbi:ZINC FINGER PROTEIN [Salix viminalis]|uniref:ZINC FINGER PROTEIN n=1 Tax=Salix viminalis TaxID=40686 RepID=A0A9Q0V608_SALVM|nr:ZINC FINGER PROTEIN [Salix viminalis]